MIIEKSNINQHYLSHGDLSIKREYLFGIEYIKYQLTEILFDEEIDVDRFRKIILLVKAYPDRTVSDIVTRFLCDFNHKLPEFFVKELMATILPPCGEHWETLKEYVLYGYQKRA